MAQATRRRVVILLNDENIGLDSVGAALLLGVTPEDEVVTLSRGASDADLMDPSTICIRAGGAGRTDLNNYDLIPEASAALQAFRLSDTPAIGDKLGLTGQKRRSRLFNLVRYVDQIGRKDTSSCGRAPFPTVCDVFGGMLLTEKRPVEQLHAGVRILKEVIGSGQDPYGTIKGFRLKKLLGG